MKNWRIAYQVAFANCAIVVIIGVVIGLFNDGDGFAFALGVVCLAGSLLDFFLAVVVRIGSSKEWAKGFLLSGGILLLLSGISCGTGLEYANFH